LYDTFTFSLYASVVHLDLHSFPTRRSSDLLLSRHAMCPREVVEKLRDGQLVIQPKRVGHVADQLMQTLRLDADLNARHLDLAARDRKSTRLNSSHRTISYAVFCLKKKKNKK